MNVGIVLRADDLIRRYGLARRRVETSEGPVDRVYSGSIHGADVSFLYGRFPGARTPSWEIPFAQNQAALDTVGAEAVIGTFVVGGVSRSVRVGDLVLPDDVVSLSGPRVAVHRPEGFTNAHVSPAFCPQLRHLLLLGARGAGLEIHSSGTYFSFFGFPRIETRAEISLLEKLGSTIVGQTLDPEFTLARQMRRHYAAIAVVIDSPHDMKPEAAWDPDDYRDFTTGHIASGRARMQQIIDAGLRAWSLLPPGERPTCICNERRARPHKNMFAPLPDFEEML